MRDRRARIVVIATLCAVAAAAASCALFEKRPPRVLEPAPGTAGGALDAAAAFVSPEDKVPGFFKKTLDACGVLAVQVVVRNGGGAPLLVHTSNGMELGAGFAGARLVCGGDTLNPLHPGEVTAILAGARRTKGYRHPGSFEMVASPIIPPVGLYMIYKEASVGRFYRPLFNRSFYPALRGGCLGAVRLEPGEERRGWLYFESPPGGRREACELLLGACVPLAVPDTIEGYEFEFSREEGPSAGGYLFALVREGKRSGLMRVSVKSLLDDPEALPERVAGVAAKAAAIADVSSLGERTVVALNFTSTSRAIVLGGGASPGESGGRAFSRAIKRVFPVADGTCVVTENGFAHFFDEETREGVPGTKLTRGFDEVALDRGRLFVFTRDKGLMVFDVAEGSRFSLVEKRNLSRGDRSVSGALGGSLALVSRGASLAGDTLSFFDLDGKAESRRGALAGRVVRASTSGSSVVLQLEDGTVLRLAAGPLGSFRIVEAGWLPFGARALKALDEAFIAVGAAGEIASGKIAAYRPGSRGAIETSVRVE